MVFPEVLLRSGVLFLSACVETQKLGVLEGPPEIIRCILVLQWPGAPSEWSESCWMASQRHLGMFW